MKDKFYQSTEYFLSIGNNHKNISHGALFHCIIEIMEGVGGGLGCLLKNIVTVSFILDYFDEFRR